MKQRVLSDLVARAWTAKGAQRVRYLVEIDLTELEALAQMAAANRSGKAKRGPISVMITKREPAVLP